MEINERMLPGKLSNVNAYEEDGKWYLSLEWSNVRDADGGTYRVVIPKLKLPFGDWTPEIQESWLCSGIANYYANFGDEYNWTLEKFTGDIKNGLGSSEKINEAVYYTVREQKEITIDEARKALESYYGCPIHVKPDGTETKICSDCKYYHKPVGEEPCKNCISKYKTKFERVQGISMISNIP